MTVEPTLPYHLARASDPSTSKQAAHEIAPMIGGLQEWAIKCVRLAPGLTARELGSRFSAPEPNRIQKRLGECVRKGWLRYGDDRRCTVSGRMAHTYYPPWVQSGHAHNPTRSNGHRVTES